MINYNCYTKIHHFNLIKDTFLLIISLNVYFNTSSHLIEPVKLRCTSHLKKLDF